jgi:hypothetical protein
VFVAASIGVTRDGRGNFPESSASRSHPIVT